MAKYRHGPYARTPYGGGDSSSTRAYGAGRQQSVATPFLQEWMTTGTAPWEHKKRQELAVADEQRAVQRKLTTERQSQADVYASQRGGMDLFRRAEAGELDIPAWMKDDLLRLEQEQARIENGDGDYSHLNFQQREDAISQMQSRRLRLLSRVRPTAEAKESARDQRAADLVGIKRDKAQFNPETEMWEPFEQKEAKAGPSGEEQDKAAWEQQRKRDLAYDEDREKAKTVIIKRRKRDEKGIVTDQSEPPIAEIDAEMEAIKQRRRGGLGVRFEPSAPSGGGGGTDLRDRAVAVLSDPKATSEQKQDAIDALKILSGI